MYFDTSFVVFIVLFNTMTKIFSMNPMVNIVSISYFCCVDGNSVSNRWLLIIFHCDNIVGVSFEFDAF